jgi:hypothetical protein
MKDKAMQGIQRALEDFDRDFYEGLAGLRTVFDFENGCIELRQWKTPKAEQERCRATCRDGHACLMRVVPGKRRCRLHGGLSTGPRTPAGCARIGESNRRRAARRREGKTWTQD